MTTAALITADLILSNDSFSKSIQDASRSADTFASKMKNVGGEITKIGGLMTAGLTLPILAAGKGMIDAASTLAESANAVNVVFGDAKTAIEDYGKTVSETAGLSQAEFNQISAVTGAFLKNVGFDAAEAADQTIILTERAADMASIFNTDVSQALAAIQSGLKGEFNPLEQFGVKLNAAAIEARALAMGLADAEGNISDAAKAQAALALVMEQTNQFAGDFVNTSDGLANSTKIMKAQFTDAAAALGTQLLPIGLKIVQVISDLVGKFNALTPAQQKAILIFAGIVAVIGPVVSVVGGLITGLGAIIPVVAAIGAALAPIAIPLLIIIGLIALLALAWKTNFLGMREGFTAMFEAMKLIFAAFKAALSGDWTAFGQLLRQAWDVIWTLIEKRIQGAWTAIKTAAQNIVNGVREAFTIDWSNLGRNIIEGIINGLRNGISAVINMAQSVAQAASDAIQGFLGIQSPSKLMFKYGQMTSQGFANGMMANNGLNIPKALMGPDTTASATPAASAGTGAGQTINIEITNPKKETAEESIRRTLKSLSYTGVIAS